MVIVGIESFGKSPKEEGRISEMLVAGLINGFLSV